jgi:hypothetical protein
MAFKNNMMKLVTAFLVFLVLPSITNAQNSDMRVALVIGNNSYETLQPLANAVNDAESISASLSAIGFTVYLVTDLDRDTLASSIEFFTDKAERADVALMYYAGHGAQIDGVNYILPTNFQLSNSFDPEDAIVLDDVLNKLSSRLRTNIVILDACLDQVILPSLTDDPLIWKTSSINTGSPRIGTLVSFATTPGTAAFDGGNQHSPFTGALLDHITAPNIDIELMFRNVRRDVVVNSNGQQVPVAISSLLSEFHLNSRPELSAKTSLEPFIESNASVTQSLTESGFQQKPILGDLSEGLNIPQNAQISPELALRVRKQIAIRNLRAKVDAGELRKLLCQQLQAPLPSTCQSVELTDVRRN